MTRKETPTTNTNANVAPKRLPRTVFDSFSNRDNARKSILKELPNGGRVRKRHWFLGSLLVLCGSWITHTTTATIAQTDTEEPTLAPQSLLTQASTNNVANSKTVSLAPAENNLASADLTSQTLLAATEVVKPEALVAEVVETAIVEPELASRLHTIKKGESLGIIFRKEGLNLAIPHHISKHPVAKQLASIRVGKTIDFRFDSDQTLKQIRYPIASLQELVVNLNGNLVDSASVLDLDFETKQHSVSAEITSSLYYAAQEAGLSNNLIMEMVRIFGWDIDFVQDIRAGDNFHIVFDEYHLGDKKLSDGHILAAEFTTQGQTYQAIRFEDSNGDASYYNAQGQSMLGTFLRSPVEFSRISSRFGKRKHPISKKWKAHKGVDYAASRGTPIRATADGKVTLAGRKGGYGKTVVLRHAGRFSTLYAHMNGFAKGIKSGSRVKQGQTIGYVGSTGMSTGPHLHYEFRVDGVHRNPLTYKTPKASSISESDKPRFEQVVGLMAKALDTVKQNYELANKSGDKQSKAI